MTDELHRVMVKLWGDDKPQLSGEGLAAVEALEQRYGIRLPEDFRRYVADMSPEEEWIQKYVFVFWPPKNIKSFRDECRTETWSNYIVSEIDAEADRYLVFADFSFWCYAYAICCSEGPNRGKIAMIGPSPAGFVASSFQSFVRLVAEESLRLHMPGGDHYTDVV